VDFAGWDVAGFGGGGEGGELVLGVGEGEEFV